MRVHASGARSGSARSSASLRPTPTRPGGLPRPLGPLFWGQQRRGQLPALRAATFPEGDGMGILTPTFFGHAREDTGAPWHRQGTWTLTIPSI
jgi:hypothetical protein